MINIFFITAIVLFCITTNVVIAETIFSARAGPFNFPKDADEKKISVEYGSPISKDELLKSNPNLRIVPMANSKSEKFLCTLPNIPTEGEKERKKSEDSMEGEGEGDVAGLRRNDPEVILDALKGVQCSYLLEGWWTYEFCYKLHVRQYHVDVIVDENGEAKKKISQEFVLGLYDKNESNNFQNQHGKNFWQKNPKSQTPAVRYHAHIFNNGTKCDLTQEPRQTEVRFLCSDSPYISIKESPSCKYTLLFHTHILCRHASFRGIATPKNKISCHPLKITDEEQQEHI